MAVAEEVGHIAYSISLATINSFEETYLAVMVSSTNGRF